MSRWIQRATDKMKRKGTLGKFGKVTAKKVARAKKAGGKAEKRAVFAENMKKIAARRKGLSHSIAMRSKKTHRRTRKG